ncbi:MAG: LptF/LptG family permease [Lactobacillaceae bacterium]|jgi:lipopolysaccharide export system permease protein|nr:LptF/LptG family permease [Lactobacillaceae bacterium]
MKKLNVYIIKQLFAGFVLVTFSLMSILWLTQSLRFIELITNKGLSISIFVELTSLLMPRLFSLISPIAIFVGTLFVYNKMLSDRELVAVKAAGISPMQIAKPVFFASFVISLFCLYVNTVGIPRAEKAFSELEWKVKSDVSHLMFREGEFSNIQPNLTIFVGAHERDGSISNIMINDERKPGLKSTISAERGLVAYTEKGPRILLVNGVRQEVNDKKNQFISISFDKYSVDVGTINSGKKKAEGAREKTLGELLTALDDDSLSDREKNRYFTEGNKRLVSPFFNVVFALMACTGLIVGSFNRRGQVKIILSSLSAMVVVQAGDLAYTNLAVKDIMFLFLYYANLALPFLICVYLLLFYNPAKSTKRKKEIDINV